MINEPLRKEFKTLVTPLIKFLNDNCDPHTTIIIDTRSAKIVRDEECMYMKDQIKNQE